MRSSSLGPACSPSAKGSCFSTTGKFCVDVEHQTLQAPVTQCRRMYGATLSYRTHFYLHSPLRTSMPYVWDSSAHHCAFGPGIRKQSCGDEGGLSSVVLCPAKPFGPLQRDSEHTGGQFQRPATLGRQKERYLLVRGCLKILSMLTCMSAPSAALDRLCHPRNLKRTQQPHGLRKLYSSQTGSPSRGTQPRAL